MEWFESLFAAIGERFTPEFLADISGRAVRVIVILLAAVIIRKFLGRVLPKLHGWAMAKVQEGDDLQQLDLERRANTLTGILAATLTAVIWSLAVVMALREVGFDITPIIAGAGVVGLAVGFGAQSLVKDVMTGLVLLVENNIRVGDVCSVGGKIGAVESVNLRTTTLRDLTGTVHVVPNGEITTVSNLTRDFSCFVFDMGISYSSDVELAKRIMTEVAEEMRSEEDFAKAILEMEIFGLDKFADSAVVIKGRIKTRPGDHWRTGREFNRRVKIRFDAEGIEIPFPQRTLSLVGQNFPVVVETRSKQGDQREPESGDVTDSSNSTVAEPPEQKER